MTEMGEGCMDNGMPTKLEIERRFLIERPDVDLLVSRYGAEVCEIEQTYLTAPLGYSSERVRRTVGRTGTVYTHTRKRRIAEAAAVEEEETLDGDGYLSLLCRADPARSVLRKCRVTFHIGTQCYEIDLYPFFTRTAVLETELGSADDALTFPPELVILREITGIPSLSNHALARRIPSEDSLRE